MHQRNRLRVVLAAITLAGLSWSAIPASAAAVVVFDEELVFRGGPGATRAWTWTNDPDHVGDTCTVTATVSNGQSDHEGNVLDVGPLRAVEIEAEPFGVTVTSGQVVLGDTGTATVTLSSDPDHAWRPPTQNRPGVWVFSGRLTATVDCDQTTPPSTTSTTLTPPTTTPSTSTTTIVDTTTTTDPATTTVPGPSTTTTIPTPSTSVPDGSTSTTVPAVDCTDDPDPAVTCPTLPFTGPVESAGVAMTAAALLLLGAGVLLAARETPGPAVPVRSPLVAHPTRRNVWVRADRGDS